MQKSALAFFILAAIASISATPVGAEIEYPWCAQYSGGEMGGGRNCGFSTIEQCRATVSGIGGFCEPNPFYPGAGSNTSQRKRKKREN
jgi:Protein of unknown function (DUF3551)